MRASRGRWAGALVVVLLIGGCGKGSGTGDGDPDGADTYDYATSRGAALYAEMCAVCHGETGEGGLGPTLLDTSRTQDELVETIEERMPANDPGRCSGDCARETAAFIRDGLTSEALRCDAIPPSPRRVRLLTRREYRNTVRDLFTAPAPAPTPSSCAHTFVFTPPAGRNPTKVHVAGSFNAWPGTIAAGGLALTHSPTTGRWSGTASLAPGRHSYKLVLDEADWIPDPGNPATEPDGLGGANSILEHRCDGIGAGFDPVVDFPVETRPPGFAFDDHADAAVVTSAHVDAYLAAADKIAAGVASHLDDVVGCDYRGEPAGCAAELVRDLGRRAFRRPLLPDEVTRYTALVTAETDFATGVATAVQALLVSPHFLYRSEVGTPQADGTYRLTAFEIASALSYTFWATTPDRELLDAAAAGKLDTPEGLERHARRLLANPKSRAVVADFALQWLGGEAIATVDKHGGMFPMFAAGVRAAMLEETRRFVAHVVFDGTGRFEELLTADYTFVDPTLAPIYGMSGVTGEGFRQHAFGDGRRAGLLGQGSVLGVYAHSDQTSPIRRGLFVRRNLLCQDLPPPPPNAGGVPDVDPTATTRERFRQHTDDPFCSSCHTYIDGVGFGFERFDAIGSWRDTENGQPIDASGNLNDVEGLGSGTEAPYTSVPELAQLLADSKSAPSCFVRQYVRFARGFRETLANRCARLAIEERFRDSGGNVLELLLATVLSPDFVVRR